MGRWVVLGPIGESYAERSADLLKKSGGPYRIQRKDGLIKFALAFSVQTNRSLILSSKWINAKNLERALSLRELRNYRNLDTIDRFRWDYKSLQSLPKILATREGVQYFERVRRIVFYAGLDQLSDVVQRIVAPEFFTRYPGGKLLFLVASPELQKALAILRIMGATLDLADRDYGRMEKFGPFKMISDVQGSGVFCPGRYLTVPLATLLPRLYGFVASKVVLSFLFMLGQPIPEIRMPYPRSGLEFFRSEISGLFKERSEIDVTDVTPESIDTFRLVDREFQQSEMCTFVSQYIDQLKVFLSFMLDPSNFLYTGSDRWAGLAHYRAWLTFERITDELILLLTDDTAYLRKVALFRVLDQLATLAASTQKDQASCFKRFLIPGHQPDIIAEGLKVYSNPVSRDLENLLLKVRHDLRSSVLESIYMPGRLDKTKGTVTLPHGKMVTTDDYVANMVRELRNTYHGYHTDKFDQYLAISTGNTPDSLPLLGVLAFFALLAKPELFIKNQWN